jgi:hypothetical protein
MVWKRVGKELGTSKMHEEVIKDGSEGKSRERRVSFFLSTVGIELCQWSAVLYSVETL